MSTTIKVLNANKEVAVHQVKKGTPLVIQAQDKVNYQLVDDATGFAPQNIIVHRNNNHLIIALDDGDSDADIVIENYYADGQTSNLIVGQHENGKMYAYVPESAEVKEAVSVLAENMTASQALGGRELATPVWTEYTQNWWVALAPLALVGALAFAIKEHNNKDDDKSNDNNDNNQTTSTTTDTTAPDAPTVTVSQDGQTISGTAEPNSAVKININGATSITVTADAQGMYTTTLATALTDGQTVSVTATDVAGNISTATLANAPFIDTTAPDTPTVIVSIDGKTIRGMAEANSTVNIDTNGDGVTDVTVTADAQGTYTATLTTALTDGQKVSVTAIDKTGNVSDATTVTAQVADTIAPEAPSVNISSDGKTISGTAEAYSVVRMDTDGDGAVDVTVTADAQGTYTTTLTKALTDGQSVRVIAVDASGNVSEATTVVAQVADTTAPNAPTISISPDGTTISGTAEANSTVNIDTNGGGTADITVTADAQGAYVATLTTALVDKQTVSVTATDKAGNTSDATVATASIADATAPDAPTVNISSDGTTISGMAEANSTVNIDTNGDGVADVTVIADAQGAYTTTLATALTNKQIVRVTATDEAGNTSDETTVTAQVVDTIAPNAPTVNISSDGTIISGTAEANSTVNIDTNGDGTADITVTADAQGVYTSTLTTALADKQAVSVTATDEAGNTSDATVAMASIADTTAPDMPDATLSSDGKTVSGTAEANATVQIDVAGDGSIDMTVQADAQGAYTATLATALSNGETISITARDEAGNTSEAKVITAPDTTPPTAPAIFATLRGEVNILPEADATSLSVQYTTNNDEVRTVTFTKDSAGQWIDGDETDDVTIDSSNGLVVVAADAVKDNTEVVATAYDDAKNPASASAIAADHTPPVAPTVVVANNQVVITPDSEAIVLSVEYINAAGNLVEVGFEKNEADNTWSATDALDSKIVTVDAQTGVVTLDLAQLEGGSQVIARNKDTSELFSEDTVFTTQDTIAPPAPISMTIGDDDGHLTATEISNDQVSVVIKLPEGLRANSDVLVVNGTEYTLSVDDIDAGSYTVRLVAPAEAATLSIEASLKDAAGNVSEKLERELVRDTIAPGDSNGDGVADKVGAPVVVIDDAKGASGYINLNDLNNNGKVNVNITLPKNSGYQVGDTLYIQLPGADKAEEIVLTEEIISNGLSREFSPVEGVNAVTAYVKDVSGNQSLEGRDQSLSSDEIAVAPVMSIVDKDSNGYLNANDMKESQNQATVHIEIPSGYQVGNTLVVNLPDGTHETITLTEQHLLTGVDVNFVAQEGENTVTAQLSKSDSVVSQTGSATVVVDTVVPKSPIITIVDANDDGYVNVDEKDANGLVSIHITFPADGGYVAKDVLIVTDASGGKQEIILTDDIITNGVTVKVKPVEGENVITAVVHDAAGNQTDLAQDSSILDNGVPGDSNKDNTPDVKGSPIVTLQDGDDGYINPADLNADDKVNVLITFPSNSGYSVGDILVVTEPNGNKQEIALTQADLSNGITVAVTAIMGNNTVVASVKDAQGNQSLESQDSSEVENSTPFTPRINVEDGGDGRLNSTELSAKQNNITASVKVPLGAVAGDILTITKNGESETITLSDEQVNAGKVDIIFVAQEGNNTITAVLTNTQGVASGLSEQVVVVDTVAPNVAALVANNDGSISITAPENAQAGDVLTIKLIQPDQTESTVTLTKQSGGEWTSSNTAIVPNIVADANVSIIPANKVLDNSQVTVASQDVAGNQATEVNSTALVGGDPDVTAPEAPTVAVSSDGQTISGTAEANATIRIDTNGDGKADLTTTANAQGEYSVMVSPALIKGESVRVTATDEAGNTSEAGQATAPMKDVTAPEAPTAEISADGTTVSGKAEAGSTVKASINGSDSGSAEAGADGQYAITLTTPAKNVETIRVTATDEAGNESTATEIQAPDLTAPATLTATIATDGVTITGQTEANATVKVDVNGNGSIDAEVQADATGAYSTTLTSALSNGETISITASDVSGNTSEAQIITVPDTTAPTELTATLASDGITLTGQTEANATIKIDVNGDGTTDAEVQADAAGAYTATLVAALSKGETISITASDVAGNTSDAVTITAPDTTPPTVPMIFANKNGAVNILPEADATSLSVQYTTNNGEVRTVTFTKDSTGQWIDGDETDQITIDSSNGLVIVAADAVKDNTEVVATAYDDAKNPASVSAIAADHTPPVAPTIVAENDKVVVTPDAEAINLSIEYTDATGSIGEVRFEKNPADNSWSSTDAINSKLMSFDAQTGVVTLALAQLEGGSQVIARNADESYIPSEAVLTTVDTIAPPAPISMTIGDDNNDYLTATEISGNRVSVVIQLPEGLRANRDILVVNGTEYTLSTDNIDAGSYTLRLTVPTEAQSLTIEAYLKDAANNVSERLKRELVRDTIAPGDSNGDGIADKAGAPVVVIEDSEETSGFINANDLKDNGKVEVTITLPQNSGYQVGDILVIKHPDQSTQEVSITDTILASGLKVEVEPTEGVNTVTAYVIDPAGNRSLEGSDKSTLDDSVALAPNITISTDSNGDGYLNATEAGANKQATAHIEIPSGYEIGNTLSITLPDGTKQDITLTRDHLRLGADVSFTVTEGANTIRATLTKGTGAVSKAVSQNITVDTIISAKPTVTIGTDSDDAIHAAEVSTEGKVDVAIGIAQDNTVVAGDVLTVRSNTGELQTIALTQEHITAGNVTVQIIAPAAGVTLSVEAIISDAANNISETGLDTAIRNDVSGTHLVYSADSKLGQDLVDDVSGTEKDDWIQVHGNIEANSAMVSMLDGQDTLSVRGYAGNDSWVKMDAGNDHVIFGDASLGDPVTDDAQQSIADNAVIELGDGNDTLSVYGKIADTASARGDAGVDSLLFSGNGVSHTLGATIQGFERIDLSSVEGRNNALTLTTDNIVNNHHADDLVVNDVTYSKVLMINGDAGDEVTLWENAGASTQQVAYQDNSYDVYTYTQNDVNYTVWIDGDITVK